MPGKQEQLRHRMECANKYLWGSSVAGNVDKRSGSLQSLQPAEFLAATRISYAVDGRKSSISAAATAGRTRTISTACEPISRIIGNRAVRGSIVGRLLGIVNKIPYARTEVVPGLKVGAFHDNLAEPQSRDKTSRAPGGSFTSGGGESGGSGFGGALGDGGG